MTKTITKEMQKKIHVMIQKSHELSMKGKRTAACDHCYKLWEYLMTLMDTQHFESIEDMDAEVEGYCEIYNWASDFGSELLNVAQEDSTYAQMRLDFSEKYVQRVRDKNDLNTLNMKRDIAGSLFQLNRIEEGEGRYLQLVQDHPTFSWGWIGWSDEYWLFGQAKIADSGKAIDILKKALDVPKIENRWDIVDRLKSIYKDLDWYDEMDALQYPPRIGELEAGIENVVKGMSKVLKQANNAVDEVRKEKIGQNEPCSCGSGKKYKKCCGAN